MEDKRQSSLNDTVMDVNSEEKRKKDQDRIDIVEMLFSKQSRQNILDGDLVKGGNVTAEEEKEWKKRHSYCGHCVRWI